MGKIVAGLLVALAITVAAQDLTRPTFHTEANYVRVEVYPTLRGTPVQDLHQDDFEIVEDKAPQKITQFEHVTIHATGIDAVQRDPTSVAASSQAAADPRVRVFVLFLDIDHVDGGTSRKIRQPLVDMLDHLIGPDDLIAIMTPEMPARGITFTRRTTTIDAMLSQYWWGERDITNFTDPVEQRYAICYPGNRGDQGIAQEMILRRREKRALDALAELVRFLREVREERKAIIAITDGWRLYGPNPDLDRSIPGRAPGGAGARVDPQSGRLTTGGTSGAVGPNDCEADRVTLSLLDDRQVLKEVVDTANRANASFYPIDPRGLVAADDRIVPVASVGPLSANPTLQPEEDHARIAERETSLNMVADGTDGLAVLEAHDMAKSMQRVVDDLNAYYLLGYYSTGKLDGKFHTLTVRVKRAGVQVRARRGFLAASSSAIAAASAAPPVPAITAAAAEAAVITAALAPLHAYDDRDAPAQLRLAIGSTPDHGLALWTVGEFSGAEWKSGGEADVTLMDAARATHATAHVSLAPGARSFLVRLDPTGPVPAGDYSIVVRSRGADAGAMTSNDTLRFAVPAVPEASGVLLMRRSAATGNKDVPTADARFRRTEQIRIEIPTTRSVSATARLLDRLGHALAVPVQSAVRDDADGSRWQTAQVALAPLGAGDYLIELTGGVSGSTTETARVLVAFRVVP